MLKLRDNSAITRNYRRWRRLRAVVLQREPTCRMCRELGKTTLATVVDHIKPRREGGGDEPENLQSLCATCHNGAKASYEATGKMRGCNEFGEPLDLRHPWWSGGGGS